MYAGPQTPSQSQPANTLASSGSNGGGSAGYQAPAASPRPSAAASNGRKAIDFVSEEDVRRAIQKGEKIYIGPRTIITPAARDLDEPAEVFAKPSKRSEPRSSSAGS